MDPFVAEIRIFAGNFAPKGWAFCNGQIIPISQNTALFSLLGTTYGGNGTSNFALPNLQGAAPMHPGQGPGLSLHELGESGGTATETLLQSQMPVHSHGLSASPILANVASPANAAFGAEPTGAAPPYSKSVPDVAMGAVAASAGGAQPHDNMPPYLTLNFIIALQGIYPPRT